MSAPKRLWSGDWEAESAALSDELARRRGERREQRPEPPRQPRPEPPRRPRPGPQHTPPPPRTPAPPRVAAARRRTSRRLRRALPAAIAVLLVLAAGAYGLTAVLGSADSNPGGIAQAATTPLYWLGMQLETVSPNAVAVETVALGSPADVAGLEPGDVITAVDGQPVHATGDIPSAIAGLGMGDVAQLQVSRGAAQFATPITLAAPPASHP